MGNFHDTTPISFVKAYGFYFLLGIIFAKKTKAWKNAKLPPREIFHVYSIIFHFSCASGFSGEYCDFEAATAPVQDNTLTEVILPTVGAAAAAVALASCFIIGFLRRRNKGKPDRDLESSDR